MFLTELSPLVQELTRQPVALLGGLFTGLLRLSLADEPVKSWLDQQTGLPSYTVSTNGHNSGAPQSISID